MVQRNYAVAVKVLLRPTIVAKMKTSDVYELEFDDGKVVDKKVLQPKHKNDYKAKKIYGVLEGEEVLFAWILKMGGECLNHSQLSFSWCYSMLEASSSHCLLSCLPSR